MLDIAGADRDRLEAREKLEATRQDMKEVASSRLTRPDEHESGAKIRARKMAWHPKDREMVADPVIVSSATICKP